jgi:MFS family permease
MDASSELVHSLLPVFMTSVLGASMVTIGVVEGIAEATGSITKIFSGAISDYVGKRKLLVVLGYGLGAATKPLFPLASSVTWVFLGRFVDRIGKGIRAHLATRWWPTLRHRLCAAPPMVCARRSTPSGSSVRSSPSY